MARQKRHMFVIVVECDDAQSEPKARERVKDWLETIGETSASHGFELKEIAKLDP